MEKKAGKVWLAKFSKLAFWLWLLCVLGAIGVMVAVLGIRQESLGEAPNIFVFILLGFVFLGIIFFGLGSLAYFVYKTELQKKKKTNVVVLFLKIGLFFAFLPFYFFGQIIQPKETIKKIKAFGAKGLFRPFKLSLFLAKSFALGLVVFVVLPVWLGIYVFAGLVVNELIIKEHLNLATEPIPLAGTGSMYPTFPKGQGKTREEQIRETVGAPGMMRYPRGFEALGRRFLSYEISRGDIALFFNEKTKEITEKDGEATGFVKRVVALPGDKVKIRDGIFYLNNEPQKEPYTNRARSTFGSSYFLECQSLTIPEGKLFVMGDNRKGSGDSRHKLGLIDYKDISHVIPWEKQIGNFDNNWRDVSRDFEEGSKIRLDVEKYLELLNKKRREAGVGELKYQPKLEKSAFKRGEVILKYDDFSYEATESGYTQLKAMNEVGYSNITWNEAITQGYYEAEELIEHFFESPDWKKFMLNKDMQEFGLAEVEGEINGCPTQVIVQHFAGYVPPNYEQETIDSWRSLLSGLEEIQPGWLKLKDHRDFYEKNKVEVDRINEIILLRINIARAIFARMEANQWLTEAEERMIDQDENLHKEQEELANKLNSE